MPAFSTPYIPTDESGGFTAFSDKNLFDALPIVEDEKPIFKDRQVKDFSESRLFKSALVLTVLPLVLAGCASSHEASDIKSPAPETTTNQIEEPPAGGMDPDPGAEASTGGEETDGGSAESPTRSKDSSKPSRAGLAPEVKQSAANPFAPFAKQKPAEAIPAKQEEKPETKPDAKPDAPVIDVPSQTIPTVKPKPKPKPGGDPAPNPNPPAPNPPVTPNPDPAPNPSPDPKPSEPVDNYVYKEKAFPGVQAAIEGAKEVGENRNFDSLKNFEKAAPNLTDYGQFSWLDNSALGEGKSVKVFSLFPFHRLAFREATFTPKEIAQFQLMATRAVEVSDLATLKEKITGLGGEENDYFLWARGDEKRLETVAKLVNQFDIPLTKEQKNILLGKDGPTKPSSEPSPSEKPAPSPAPAPGSADKAGGSGPGMA